MNTELAFQVTLILSTIGWIALFLFPRKVFVNFWLCGTIIPGMIGIFYAVLCVLYWNSAPGGFMERFGSLKGALAMFNASGGLLLAGFIHYLAFDLFIGAWEARRGTQGRWPYLLFLPSLVLTLLFGPAGVLVCLITLLVRGEHKPEHVPL
jgi:hypothetical protein